MEKEVVRQDGEGGNSISRVDRIPKFDEKSGYKDDLEKNAAPKLWVDVIKGNRRTVNGKALAFVAPNIVEGKPVVKIVQEDVESEIKYWETSLIMYAIGGDLSMNAVKNFMI